MTKMKAGDEIEVDGKVYVVALNASVVLFGTGTCAGCVGNNGLVNDQTCLSLKVVNQFGYPYCPLPSNQFGYPYCPLPRHLIFKLKGDSDVQDENADDRQVSLTEERQPTDMG